MYNIPLYNKFIIFVPYYENTISENLKCIENRIIIIFRCIL